jgi:hypothetical protein
MINPVVLAAAFAGLALGAAPPAPVAPAAPPAPERDVGLIAIPTTLDWRVDPAGQDQPGQVQFEIGFRTPHNSWMSGETVQLSTLDGLSAQALQAGGNVAFTLHRDAGAFRCDGVAREGRGEGFCTYVADAAFPAALEQRGVGRPDELQQFELAIHDIGFAYLDELKRQRYATPGVADLVRAGEHGAGLRQLAAFDAAGYRFGDVPTLIKVRDHGVSARYVEALNGYGVKHQSAEDLVQMRDHGVSATYIGELSSHGYKGLAAQDLVRMRDHGVSASYVAELDALGYAGLKPETLESLRDHGVSTGFVRTANARSGEHLTPETLIRLRDTGGRE